MIWFCFLILILGLGPEASACSHNTPTNLTWKLVKATFWHNKSILKTMKTTIDYPAIFDYSKLSWGQHEASEVDWFVWQMGRIAAQSMRWVNMSAAEHVRYVILLSNSKLHSFWMQLSHWTLNTLHTFTPFYDVFTFCWMFKPLNALEILLTPRSRPQETCWFSEPYSTKWSTILFDKTLQLAKACYGCRYK